MKDLTIELTVLKYFIRALKLRNMYHLFTSINPSIIRLRNAKQRVPSDSPFLHCRTLNDIADVIKKLNSSIDSHHHRMMSPDMSDHRIEQITMCINHLIHFFVEPTTRDMNLFNQIGQSVFEAAVRDLWGDEYLAQANTQMSQMEANAPDRVRAMLWELYLKLSSEGKITCSFDDFVEKANHMTGMQPPMGVGDNNDFVGHAEFDDYDDEYNDDYDDGYDAFSDDY